ncbi:flavodoxin family protein [Modestobacter muralis]|uniref:FMN dependent NADH:quinone oxidoreductase n=1 Tax=Modestobacter muralis TaxID=1608614 RepID=A0A6P0H5Y2_9ACTN|nr:NAD(P)H-dependent oxidoreductase [Modestobacter muralis]NEK93892.1 flavodoxin family protein [Modestobacter muralis]NEN50659.1 flavodoxin family protein [Modestobacter muralis]
MSLFRLDGSIRVEGSASRAIADIVEREWRAENPDAPVTRRHVGTEPLPATAWADAVSGSYLPADQRTPAQTEAAALAATLADELADAEALLFAVPLYNFGVSQHVKTYVDMVITDPRFGPHAEAPTIGKPAVLVTVRGGNYSAGTPREGWDHATSWMRRILEDVWGMDLRVVERDFTLVGVNPALDSFTEMAAELKETAEREAAEHGRLLTSARAAA